MPEATKVFPDGHFNCCISSPPYWALRDYGVEGQLGLEPTFEEYIDKLCTIYDEVKRVLRDDGTCWVNLGDTYWGGKGQSGRCDHNIEQRIAEGRTFQRREYTLPTKHCPQDGKHDTVQAKSLCLIPQRFAVEMVNRGWILRNVIIWHKPNPMPSSAKDRFTVDFEYVYFFVKSRKYWFETQYEPYLTESNAERPRMGQGNRTIYKQKRREHKAGHRDWQQGMNIRGKDAVIKEHPELGRNKRCVWTISTQPFPEAHFATYPEKLVEPMIKAGCPEFVCAKCGKAREKIYETVFIKKSDSKSRALKLEEQGDRSVGLVARQGTGNNEHHFKGYTDCGCNAGWRPGIVLDCFLRKWNLAVCSRAA
jgi:site-specific DNA-methyltransferase (adenine-specific)